MTIISIGRCVDTTFAMKGIQSCLTKGLGIFYLMRNRCHGAFWGDWGQKCQFQQLIEGLLAKAI